MGPNRLQGSLPKWKTLSLEAQLLLKGRHQHDGPLAGTVGLSPTLAGSLRGAVDTDVVGNMEYEGLNTRRDWILYSISLPRTRYFLTVPPEDCRGNTVGPEGA